MEGAQVRAWLSLAARRAQDRRADLDRLDAVAGDGDHGAANARAWTAAADAVATAATDDPGGLLRAAAGAVRAAAGGTAGVLLADALAAMAGHEGLAGALDAAVVAVAAGGGAAPGDKTMLDALAPAAEAARRAGTGTGGGDASAVPLRTAATAAADAALAGAEATTAMVATAGRARRVAGGGAGSPDPGATSLADALHALALVVDDVAPPTPPVPLDAVAEPAARPRKLLNDVADAVDEMLDGLLAAQAHRVTRGPRDRIVVRARPKDAGRVALVIGNGSGHEPIAVGWVGEGLLDANACGDVFTAPPPDLLADAIVAADRGAGVVVLVSQHDGDVLCARDAVSIARSRGVRAEPLHLYDDVATAPPERRSERRGAPGTTFAYKVLGAAAEAGTGLEDLLALGARLRDATSTLTLGLGPGTSPLTGAPTHHVPSREVLVGTGVHGEGGSGTLPHGPVDDLVAHVLDVLLADLPAARPDGSPWDDEVLVLVNGAGGTTLMELLVVHRAVDARLRAEGLVPFRPLVGELVTTQETAGVAVSLARTDPEIRRWWTAPCDAPYFPPPGPDPDAGPDAASST